MCLKHDLFPMRMQNRILKSLTSQGEFKEGFKGSFAPLIIKVRDNLDSICANLR